MQRLTLAWTRTCSDCRSLTRAAGVVSCSKADEARRSGFISASKDLKFAICTLMHIAHARTVGLKLTNDGAHAHRNMLFSRAAFVGESPDWRWRHQSNSSCMTCKPGQRPVQQQRITNESAHSPRRSQRGRANTNGGSGVRLEALASREGQESSRQEKTRRDASVSRARASSFSSGGSSGLAGGGNGELRETGGRDGRVTR